MSTAKTCLQHPSCVFLNTFDNINMVQKTELLGVYLLLTPAPTETEVSYVLSYIIVKTVIQINIQTNCMFILHGQTYSLYAQLHTKLFIIERLASYCSNLYHKERDVRLDFLCVCVCRCYQSGGCHRVHQRKTHYLEFTI